jgi:hypothetical protein
MITRILLLLLIFSFGCGGKKVVTESETQTSATVNESVVDSVALGVAGQYKIDIRQMRNEDDEVTVAFELFRKQERNWEKIQSFTMQKDPITSLGISFADFNNDGYNDMTFVSGAAAQSANEIRTLFIFDKTAAQLTHILNSSEYPNLRYNATLDCVDAWLRYGGSSTVFLKIDGDSLREFGGIDLFEDTRTIYEVDENGIRSVLQKDEIDGLDADMRYKNYYPAIPDSTTEQSGS